MAFAVHFPYLANPLVLLGPAGLLRCVSSEYENMVFRYASIIPSKYLRWVVGKTMGADMSKKANLVKDGVEDNVALPDNMESDFSIGNDDLTVQGIVQWHLDNHSGFSYSFSDTIRFGPLMNQQSVWIKTRDRHGQHSYSMDFSKGHQTSK